jgi:hypothetical protein
MTNLAAIANNVHIGACAPGGSLLPQVDVPLRPRRLAPPDLNVVAERQSLLLGRRPHAASYRAACFWKPLSLRSHEIDRINNLIINTLDLMHSNFACDLPVRT